MKVIWRKTNFINSTNFNWYTFLLHIKQEQFHRHLGLLREMHQYTKQWHNTYFFNNGCYGNKLSMWLRVKGLFLPYTFHQFRGGTSLSPFQGLMIQLIFSFFNNSLCLGNSALTKLLEKIPRLMEAREVDGCTPLFAAAIKGSCDAAELLIKKVNILMGKAYRYTLKKSQINYL